MCDEKDRNLDATATGSFNKTTCPAHMSPKPEFVTNNKIVIIPHPPYLLDLAPCDYALFPKLKMKLTGHFETVSDIQRVLDSIKENDFHGAFEAWKKRQYHCIHSQGYYFEGDDSKN
jgi:hypothetical protein